MKYTIGEVAKLAHVTVRALHHYDDIGLLRPAGRSESGYRLYDDDDLARLQQILIYRQLGFSLDKVAQILSDPHWDEVQGLRAQRRLLSEQAERLGAVIVAIDRALEAHRMGINLTPEERFEVFGDFNPDDYAEEAQERWGDTDAYKESRRRTAKYSKEQWLAIQAEGDAAVRELLRLFEAGVPASEAQAADAVDLHRQQIDHWFYACSRQMHLGVLEMQVGDDRFRAWWDRHAEGLLDYAVEAARTNAARDA